jgi:hypothetical protein
MQINYHQTQADRGGFALPTTLIILGALLLVFATIFSLMSSNAVNTQRNKQYFTSQSAAEAAAEIVISAMYRDFLAHSLVTNGTGYTTLPATIDQSSWPVQYVFSDTNGVANQVSVVVGPEVNTQLTSGQYHGLYSYARTCTVIAKATPISQPQTVPAAVQEQMQFAEIPLFQYAIFFNVNLEMDPGATMTVTGPVFCNQNIWEGSTLLSFASTVQAAGTNSDTVNNPFAVWKPGSAPATFLLGTSEPENGVKPLMMPIGTNNDPAVVRSVLDLPPTAYAMGTAGAYTANGQVYMANEANLIVSNAVYGTNSPSPVGTNLFVYLQDSAAAPYLTLVTNDYYVMTNRLVHSTYPTNYVPACFCSNIVYAGYTFATNVAFGDWREMHSGQSATSRTVQAVQISVTNLCTWFKNSQVNGGAIFNTQISNHWNYGICSLFVYNSVPPTATTLPAVRMVNGARLPDSGLTVITPFPIYVKGDYNVMDATGTSSAGSTTHTKPAALMGDAVTILSNGWQDSTTSENPVAQVTTVNAAAMGGIVQTSPLNPTLNGWSYSGGAHNFLRNLENWHGVTLNYNGSIVVPFYSKYATNQLASGISGGAATTAYYTPPNRNYAFDLNFLNDTLIPPLTPRSLALVRGQWSTVNGF